MYINIPQWLNYHCLIMEIKLKPLQVAMYTFNFIHDLGFSRLLFVVFVIGSYVIQNLRKGLV